MEIGFVHFSAEERKRVINALERLREHGSVDELGIGRVRDAFADMMFPGISTLQHHAKYFAVLPHLYHIAQKDSYKNPREVKQAVINLEIKLTKNLVAGSKPNTTGITGSKFTSGTKYVKYDPTYIYWTGLVSFGIMKESGSLYNLIYDYSKHDKAPKYRAEYAKEGGMDDADGEGVVTFYSKPNTDFDIKKDLNVDLEYEEADFIKQHILSSERTRYSLLAYFLQHDEIKVNQNENMVDFDSSVIQEPELRRLLVLSQKFAWFIYPMHIRYNYIFAEGCEDESADELNKSFLTALNDARDVYNRDTLSEIFTFLGTSVNDVTIRNFCEDILENALLGKESLNFSKLDNLLVNRERSIKPGNQYKLRHQEAYPFDPKHLVHNHMLSYRWITAWTMINEIRKGLKKKA